MILLFGLPYKNLRMYILVLLFGGLFLFFDKDKISINFFVKFLLSILLYFIIGFIFRSLNFIEPNTRDLTEIMRYTPILIIFLFYERFRKIKLESVCTVLIVYISVDFIISLCEWFNYNNSIVSSIRSIYQKERPIGDGGWFRSLGLSPGPGQHGVIMIMSFIVLFYKALNTSNRFIIYFIFSIISTIIVLFSQSQTAFISLCFSAVLILVFNIIYKKRTVKIKAISILAFATSFISYNLLLLMENLQYLFTLFTQGLKRNSYVARQSKAKMLIEDSLYHPIYSISGWGKEFYGDVSGHMDNEYLFILLVYGPLIIILLGILVTRYFFKFLFNPYKAKTPINNILFFIIIAGMIIAWPSSFFTFPLPLIFICILMVMAYWEKIDLHKTSQY